MTYNHNTLTISMLINLIFHQILIIITNKVVVPNFAQIGGFLYFGRHLWFQMATIANQNGRHMVQHVLLPPNIHFH
jgi:hypothetical protein